MKLPPVYHLPKDINHRIGAAMHRYAMLADRDRVLIAVSGGIDSLVLAWLLHHWQAKAPISYELLAVHIDLGFNQDGSHSRLVAEELTRLAIPFIIEKTDFGPRALAAEGGKSTCYHCARLRRNHLFALAADKAINKIAFGHHRDDILETFFLNLLYGGNISTMTPRQELFSGRLSIIRPLACIDKQEITAIGAALGITAVKNPCPADSSSKRQEVRRLLTGLCDRNPKVKANIFAALSNIRPGYQLQDAARPSAPETNNPGKST